MTLRLKNNQTTEDARLDRLVQFDERSRGWAARDVLPSDEPRQIHWRLRERLDQGAEGACVGFWAAHEIKAQPIMQRKGIDARYAREQIYWEAQRIDPWPGGSYPGASPHYEGTSMLAGVKVLKNLGHISEYRWAFGLEDLILAVSHLGPAGLGLNWYAGMWNTDDKGYIHVTGRNQGGHAILCRGVNPRMERFTLSNSWGRRWGRSGDCFITFDDMDRLLNENGEACIPLARQLT